jgi:hypothetical protein
VKRRKKLLKRWPETRRIWTMVGRTLKNQNNFPSIYKVARRSARSGTLTSLLWSKKAPWLLERNPNGGHTIGL